MTGPIDDRTLRASLQRLTQGGGVDPDELASGAMRRGRQRRQRQRGALASVAAAAALAVAVPTLAAPGDGNGRDTSVASTGEAHDGVEGEHPRDDKEREEVDVEKTTTTLVEEPSEEPKPEAEPAEPKPDGEGDQKSTPPTTKPDPKTPPTTEKPAPPELELLELWCGRGSGEEVGGVVCEVTLSEHPDFAWYELRRQCADEPGKPWETAATYEHREMPERPWPDIRFFDPAGEPQYPWHYQVLVHDGSGKVIGKSNVVKVPAAEAGPAGGGGEG